MTENTKLHLKATCILKVPIHNFQDDFRFIVNNEEFKTNRLIADILSPNICQIHANDPAFDTFTIKTKCNGNFSRILDLVNFDEKDIPNNELPFIFEVFQILGTDQIHLSEPPHSIELNVQNVFKLLQQHEPFKNFYSKSFSEEIEFIASHFHELSENHDEDFKNLEIDTLAEILTSNKLQLKSEDQLLKFVNKIYSNNSMYSNLYETVQFQNVTVEAMRQFMEIYQPDDITAQTWIGLSKRLLSEVKNDGGKSKGRYTKEERKEASFLAPNDNSMTGIISYLMKESSGKIEEEVAITSSSCNNNEERFQARNVVLYDDKNKIFMSANSANSWIQFDFKERRVVPTAYTMRSGCTQANWANPYHWQLQGSNDGNSWKTLDAHGSCSDLNGINYIHTYKINNQGNNKYKYLRIYSTGADCNNSYFLAFEAIEFFGKLI